MRELLDRLDGWRDEQIAFLERLVNHDSGTDDVLDVTATSASSLTAPRIWTPP